MDLEQRNFRADPLKLKRLRIAAGLTVKDFARLAEMDRTTVSKILRGAPVFLKSLQLAAKRALDIDNPLELLHPDELEALGVATEVPSPNQVLEWTITDYLTGWKKTSNGLQYQVVRLRHRFLPHRFARGKCYELRHLTAGDRKRLEFHLQRHGRVCELVGAHPHIADNLTATWVGGLWWVIDRWEDGQTMEQRLEVGPFDQHELRHIMTGMAEGLQALHEKGVIRRELSPSYVLLTECCDCPILTDLELAKLTEGVPTVSPQEWPDDPYRALEVTGNTPIDARADVYSWGRVFVHAAHGVLPERGTEQLDRLDLPREVSRCVIEAVSPSRGQRPDDMQPILAAMKSWS